MNANTHIHLPPNFSAFETVADAVQAAADEGIQILGANNYYDYTVYLEFTRLGWEAGVFPLTGMEIVARDEALAEAGIRTNDPGNPGKVYICGKATARCLQDPMRPEPRAIRDRIRQGDAERIAAMVDRIAAIFEAAGLQTGIGVESIKQMVIRRHHVRHRSVYLQERHVALAFQEWLFRHVAPEDRAARLSDVLGVEVADATDAGKVQDALRSHLMKAGKPGFVEERFVSVQEARKLILEMGGIPCYPVFADGAGAFTPFEEDVERLIAGIKAWDIHAAEFITTRNSPEVLAKYVPAMRAAGLVVTAGTEHNTLERMPLTPTAKGGAPIPPEAQEIFEEGALVLVAHEACVTRLEEGYVDHTGRPEAGFASDDERIRALAHLGKFVLEEVFPRIA